MFDKQSLQALSRILPQRSQQIISHLEKREPWIIHNSEEIDNLIEDIGIQLRSHQQTEKLNTLTTDELTTLFTGLTISRYLSAVRRLGSFDNYEPLLQRIHNDLETSDTITQNHQRLLILRLHTLVRYEVIQRVFSPKRIATIESLLVDAHFDPSDTTEYVQDDSGQQDSNNEEQHHEES